MGALTLPADDPNLPELCRDYSWFREAARHFTSQHLSRLAPKTKVICPVCPNVVLKHRDHFRNHAERVHGIRTATAKGEPTDAQWVTSLPTLSSRSDSSRRSQSPFRRSHLTRLTEPIVFGIAKFKELPQDVASLQPGLNDLLDKDGILPSCLKSEASFLQECNDDLRNRMFAMHDTDLGVALDEFKEVLKIMKATEKAIHCGFAKPAWNNTVYSRVLELALTSFDTVEWNNM
ncbi:C2H2 finger domain protein [Diaporthe eres]|nr:C2H2 finger domain protein [Diaporthe eres]